MPWSLIIDVIILVLLMVAIFCAFLLHRRLSSLRADRGDLENFIQRFNDATERANKSLGGLRKAAENSAKKINEASERAQALRDELAFLVERADVSAEKLATVSHRPDASEPENVSLAGLDKLASKPDHNLSDKSDIPNDLAQQQSELDMPFGNEVDSEAELELLKALRKVR